MSQMSFSVANQQYVCMQCLLNVTDTHQIPGNKHKKQSQNDVLYKAAKPKIISLDKAI